MYVSFHGVKRRIIIRQTISIIAAARIASLQSGAMAEEEKIRIAFW
jgi:hypothetical protein